MAVEGTAGRGGAVGRNGAQSGATSPAGGLKNAMGKTRWNPQESVVVSLDNVREMLQRDVSPAPKERALPMAIPVAPVGQTIEHVPSAAEVAAEREARWSEEMPALASPRRRYQLLRYARTAGLFLTGLVVGIIVTLSFHNPGVPPEAEAQLAAQSDSIAELSEDVRTAQSKAVTTQMQLAALAEEKTALEENLAALAAPRASARSTRSAKPRLKRKRARRSTRRRSAPDARFERLLDSL